MSEDGFDRWDIAGNTHLLAFIRKVYGRGRKVPGRPISYRMFLRSRKPPGLGEPEWTPTLDAGPVFIANVRLLVAAKNVWAEKMREAAGFGLETPVDKQREIWRGLIGEAWKLFTEGE